MVDGWDGNLKAAVHQVGVVSIWKPSNMLRHPPNEKVRPQVYLGVFSDLSMYGSDSHLIVHLVVSFINL